LAVIIDWFEDVVCVGRIKGDVITWYPKETWRGKWGAFNLFVEINLLPCLFYLKLYNEKYDFSLCDFYRKIKF